MDDGLNYEDIVISSLILLAPKKLTLHGLKNSMSDELIAILEKIFGENEVIKCAGCQACSHSY